MASNHIKVLLIEDNPGDVRLIWEILSEVRNSPFYLSVADSLLNGLKEIEKEKPHIILLDLSLGDSNGIYTLNRVRDKAKDVPIVILTGMDDEMTAIKSLKEGAQDYLVKGRTDSDLLKKAIIYSIERFRLISELEEKQTKLEEQDTTKYNFTLMVFHELLIPATSIKSAVNLMEKNEAGENTGGKDPGCYTAMIKNNTQNIFALLDDLINVSEIEAGTFAVKREQTNIAGMIKGNAEDISAYSLGKKMTITLDIPADIGDAKVDARRIKQALNNLIINSVKFSNEEAVINVSLRSTDMKDILAPEYVKQQCPAGRAYQVLSVRDNGAGISNQNRLEIFDPFFSSTKTVPRTHKGIGIGLIIAKNIVSAHGGCMWAVSEGEGKGSAFNIVIPVE